MGYNANSVDVDFTIPADRISEALATIEAEQEAHYASLTEFVESLTCFEDCEEDPDKGFRLGYHIDKWLYDTEAVIALLGRFATEGSYVRLCGEDDSLWGYRVVDGQLREELGDYTWTLCPLPAPTGAGAGEPVAG